MIIYFSPTHTFYQIEINNYNMTYLVASVYSTHFHYAFLDILNQPVCAEYPPVGDLFRSVVGQLFSSVRKLLFLSVETFSLLSKKKKIILVSC